MMNIHQGSFWRLSGASGSSLQSFATICISSRCFFPFYIIERPSGVWVHHERAIDLNDEICFLKRHVLGLCPRKDISTVPFRKMSLNFLGLCILPIVLVSRVIKTRIQKRELESVKERPDISSYIYESLGVTAIFQACSDGSYSQ